MNQKLHGLLESHQERGYAVLRIMVGWMFAFHGLQKVLHILPKYPPPPVGSQLWVGGVIEIVAGFAIMLGLFTTISAFLSSGMMAVAYLQFHWNFQFDKAFFPANNGGELAVVYSFLFRVLFKSNAGYGILALLIGLVFGKRFGKLIGT